MIIIKETKHNNNNNSNAHKKRALSSSSGWKEESGESLWCSAILLCLRSIIKFRQLCKNELVFEILIDNVWE